MPDTKSFDTERRIPVVEEELFVDKQLVETEHVRIHTSVQEKPVLVRDTVLRENLEIRRVPVDREVDHTPPVREEGGVTVIPVVEERLVVEKRLFLIEEIHIARTQRTEAIELPTTLRRTQVDIDRTDLIHHQEDAHGRT